jgi:hypothetical protein
MTSPRAQVYGVSLDSVDVTRRYAARNALPYPTIRFPEEKLVSMYRAGAVPLTLVLDETGRTVYSRLGEISTPAAIDSVIAAVKEKPQPRRSAPAAPPAPNTTAPVFPDRSRTFGEGHPADRPPRFGVRCSVRGDVGEHYERRTGESNPGGAARRAGAQRQRLRRSEACAGLL